MTESMIDNHFVTTWGAASNPRVVMIHGSAQGSPMSGADHFSAQQKLADRGWCVVAPDRSGHGKSPATGHPDDVDLEGQWVSQLLGGGAHLVGHSLGGAISFSATAQRPEGVRSLTLIEPALHMMAIGDPIVREFLGKQMALFSSGLPSEEVGAKFTQLVGIPDQILKGRSVQSMVGLGDALKAIRWPTPGSFERYAETIAAAKVPLLVVSGGWNPAFEVTCDLVAKLANGQRRVIRSPHHFPNLISEEFNDTLNAFMLEADKRRAA